MSTTTTVDVLGIGLGPSNLSLAALSEPVPELRVRVLERESSIRWHPGMLLPETRLQVSFLKDLVTLVDPTSRLSFLNYLAVKGRLYRFLVACATDGAFRREFADYYQWAADLLSCVQWSSAVVDVALHGDELVVRTDAGDSYRTRNLVLGSGRTPNEPDFIAGHDPTRVMHSSRFNLVCPDTACRDVVVIGAGQSGGEVVRELLSNTERLPASLTWISSRANFLPLDDSPFTNEWFQPSYVDYFVNLPTERQEFLLAGQRLASDGISEYLLREIYRRLYYLDIAMPGRLTYRLLASRRVVDLRADGGRYLVALTADDLGHSESYPADVVICCTGYRNRMPPYLASIQDLMVTTDNRLNLAPDYQVCWTGPPDVRIYAQNFGEFSHGISDPNLSLIPWRSARIINSLTGRTVYRTDNSESTIQWSGPGLAPADGYARVATPPTRRGEFP